ncbi:phosphatidylglycerophosphatase and protein-tyrosine phosphatase 1-like [Ptychodera flava]|uniref:phosphatidylglycerophosphatase and protein-tyrosine phosphatase 1-like n=1 Tax=Ptychodera flava TaxID=63121 RepID=UPI003969EA21
MSGCGSLPGRLLFYPTLCYNIVMAKLSLRRWYNRIDAVVILGALPFRGMTRQLVEDENVRGVVTLNEKYETKYFVNTKDEWSEAGVEQIQLCTPDFVGSPSQDAVNEAIDFIYKYKERDESVYVHCKAGRTRSATIVACYLMKENGWSPQEAYNYIRGKRRHILFREKQWNTLRQYYESEIKT